MGTSKPKKQIHQKCSAATSTLYGGEQSASRLWPLEPQGNEPW